MLNKMVSEVFLKSYSDFEVNEKEVLRYAGCREISMDDPAVALMRECAKEVIKPQVISYNISYRILPISSMDEKSGDIDFEIIKVNSRKLNINLEGCSYAVFFAATIGSGIDRYIYKYNKINPAKALFMQAIGAERIETMLDAFVAELPEIVGEYFGKEVLIRPRFSPGFGDLSLSIQPDFLQIVNATKRLGITLNDSLLMSPSKSVTAIAGVREK